MCVCVVLNINFASSIDRSLLEKFPFSDFRVLFILSIFKELINANVCSTLTKLFD